MASNESLNVTDAPPDVDSSALLQEMMLRNYPAPGAADIYCMGPPSFDRLAEEVSVLLGMSNGQERPVAQVTIIRPPLEEDETGDDEVLQAIAQRIGEDSGEGNTPEIRTWLARAIQICHAENLGHDALVAALPPAAPKRAIVVTSAVRYRAPDLKIQTPPGLGQPENFWSPHLARLAERCVAVAKERSYYVMIDAGEYAPFRQQNQELLLSVDSCGVVNGAPVGSPDQEIADRAVVWLDNIDPPSFQWTPMLAFRSWRGVSDARCEAAGFSGVVQTRGG